MSSPSRLKVPDGMRGAAAAMVLVYHAGLLTGGRELLPRGYLAVDFFFMLSGFVMARTFEPRFAVGLDLRTFMGARLRRLYPVMAAGIVLGAVALASGGLPPAAVIGILTTELLFVPWFAAGMNNAFRCDGVQWSLLFELFANAAHALVLHKLSTRVLFLVALCAFVVLAIVAWRWGDVAVGYRGASFWGGMPRVLFSYVTGIVLARRAPFALGIVRTPALVPVILLALVIVSAGSAAYAMPGWIVDLGVVAFAFPVLILLGAESHTTVVGERLAAAAGSFSYPLYAMHIPAIALTLQWWGGRFAGSWVLFGLCLAMAVLISGAVRVLMAPAVPRRRRLALRPEPTLTS